MQTLIVMKHSLLILTGLVSLIAYSSCKKEYACQCIHKYYATDTVKNIVTSSSEKRAEAACKSGNGVSATMYNCNLMGETEIATKK